MRGIEKEGFSRTHVSPWLKQFRMNPPEVELCLVLARAQLSPQARERAQELLATPLHWEFLFERTKAFGFFPLVYTGLSTRGFPGGSSDRT